MLMERWSSRDWFNRVDPNLIIGAIPFKSMAHQLVEIEVHVFKHKNCDEYDNLIGLIQFDSFLRW